MTKGLAPWFWLAAIPKDHQPLAMALWKEVLRGIVKATPRREDPRVHVSDVLAKAPKDDELLPPQARYFLDGLWVHEKWKTVFEAMGCVVAYEPEIVSPQGIVGTPDFVVSLPFQGEIHEFPVDIKSVGAGRYKQVATGAPVPRDRNQMVLYLASGRGWDCGFLLYEDRDSLDLTPICVLPDPEKAKALIERRKRGNESLDEELPAEEVPSERGLGRAPDVHPPAWIRRT